MRIVERRAKSGIYLTTTEASVEAMALFARAGVPLDPILIYETVELRKIHEIKAAELACNRATEENYQHLRDILAASEAKLAAGEGLAREDRDFHLEIVRATKNSVFHRVCSVYYVMGEHRLPIYFADAARSRRSHRGAYPHLRGAACPRRQSRPGADERASSRSGKLLEGPHRRSSDDGRIGVAGGRADELHLFHTSPASRGQGHA